MAVCLRWRSCVPWASVTRVAAMICWDKVVVMSEGPWSCYSALCCNHSIVKSGVKSPSLLLTSTTQINRSAGAYTHTHTRCWCSYFPHICDLHFLLVIPSLPVHMPKTASSVWSTQLGSLWAGSIPTPGTQCSLLPGGCGAGCARVPRQGVYQESVG